MQDLRTWRKEKNLSQEELGRLAGVTRLTVISIENRHKEPRQATIRCVAAALGVEPDDISEFSRVKEELAA